MEYTVLREGKPYIATEGQIQRYPKFNPENHVLLKQTPSKWEDKWYQWNQELPANASAESKQQAREFSELKIGWHGVFCSFYHSWRSGLYSCDGRVDPTLRF